MDLKKLAEQVAGYEKEVNDMAFKVWEIGRGLSKEFGTRVTVEFECVYEYDIALQAVVKVPRPCGCCNVMLLEPLTLDTPNLKNIVLKMRKIETMMDEDYTDIYIPFEIEDFEQASVDEIIKQMRVD